MSTDTDVVVVGGGHNGLVCAVYLARAGVGTLLLEARSSVGGCASTVASLGARFNICSCDHTLVRAMPFQEELDLEKHGLRYLEADPAHVYINYPDAQGSDIRGARRRRVSSAPVSGVGVSGAPVSGVGVSGVPGSDSAPWLFFNDVERTVESIALNRPEAAEAYRRYLADAMPVAELVLELGTGVATTPRMLGSAAPATCPWGSPVAEVESCQCR